MSKNDVTDRTVKLLQKKFGELSAQRLGTGRQSASQVKEVIPIGIEVVDYYSLGTGGLPIGRMSEVMGEEGCLAADTRINFIVRRSDGTVANSKGGTVKRLFERFHGIRRGGPLPLEGAWFSAPCVNENDRILHNRVVDVISSGVRECFELVTTGGERITTTADHEFYVGDGHYAQLRDIGRGDLVYVHRNVPWQSEDPEHGKPSKRSYLFVKQHPIAGTKTVGAYVYKRVARSRAVVEAYMNGLSLVEFVERLNSSDDLSDLEFLDREQHVHHKDENVTNDELSNLVVKLGTAHNREHAIENSDDLRFVAVKDAVADVVPVGPRETFDVKMADPYRNVVANRVVVHNCGKTALGYQCMAACQRIGGTAWVADAEFSFDEHRAAAFGVDVDALGMMQPRSMEMALEQTKLVLASHDAKRGPLLIVWDTIAAMVPEADLGREAGERGTAEQARLMSTELPKLIPMLTKHRAHLLALNQVRANIGVMFGPNTTTSGGKAVKFYASWRAQFFGGKAVKDGDEHTGKIVTLLTVKTRFTPPFRKARVRLDYGGGWNNEWSTLEHAKKLKLAQRGAKGAKAHAAAIKKLGWQPQVTVVSAGSERKDDGEE